MCKPCYCRFSLHSIPASKGRVLLADCHGLIPRVSPRVCPPVKSEYEGFTGRADGTDRIKVSHSTVCCAEGKKSEQTTDCVVRSVSALPLQSIRLSVLTV